MHMRRVLLVLSLLSCAQGTAQTPPDPESVSIRDPLDADLTPAPVPDALIDAKPPEHPPGPVPPENLSGRGLFNFKDPSAFALLHLQLPVDTLEYIQEGRGKVDLGFHWANNFVLGDTFVIDAETYIATVGGWYALHREFYIGAEIPVLARGSGILDPLIDEVHETFHFGDGQRSERGTNDYNISIQQPGGETARLDQGFGLGDIVLKTHWNLNDGGKWFPAVSLQGLMSLPTSTKGFGSSGMDVGLAVSFYKTFWKRFHLYAVLGGTYLTDSKTEGIRYERETNQAVVGAEVRVGSEVSIIVQYMSFSPLLRSPTPLNRTRNYVTGGIKWEFMPGSALELGVVENLYPFTSSSDIALSAGLSFRL